MALATVCAATTVSALFTAPAHKKRSRDEAPTGRGVGAAGAPPVSIDARDDDDAAAERGPPAKRRVTTAPLCAATDHADSTYRGTPPTGGMPAPASARQPSAAQSDTSEDPSTSAAAGGVRDGCDNGGADGGTGRASGSSSLADLPFPPEHYVATIAELEVHEFPLPLAGPGGELICPPGYMATRRKQGARWDDSPCQCS